VRRAACQGRQGQHLRFAAGEQAGAMGARADIDLAPDGANVTRPAPIRAQATFQDTLAHNSFIGRVESFFDFAR